MFRGDRLRELRKAKGINQEDLGILLDVSTTIITRYEKNQLEPKCDYINVLANYFNVSTDYLLGRIDKQLLVNELTDRETKLICNYKELDERDQEEIFELTNLKHTRLSKIKNASELMNGEEAATNETA